MKHDHSILYAHYVVVIISIHYISSSFLSTGFIMPSHSSECTGKIYSQWVGSHKILFKTTFESSRRKEEWEPNSKQCLDNASSLQLQQWTQWEVIVRERDVYFNANHKLTPHPYLNINQKRLAWSCLFDVCQWYLRYSFSWPFDFCVVVLVLCLYSSIHADRVLNPLMLTHNFDDVLVVQKRKKSRQTASIFHLNWTSPGQATHMVEPLLQFS